jgi:regulator of sigma E protease
LGLGETDRQEGNQNVPFDKLIQIITEWIYPGLLVVFFFGLTIFIHELGHFVIAQRRGMLIERFSIGFGPKIWGWTKNGVDYRISWFPFGGYVALPQMSTGESLEGKSAVRPEDLPPASPQSKVLVALAGPVMNLVLAVVLASILWVAGKPMNAPVVGWVETGSPEELAGICPGDRIVAVNGKEVKTWTQLMEDVAFSLEPTVNVTVERKGERFNYLLEAKLNERLNVKMLEVYPREHPFAQKVFPNSPAERAGLRLGDQFVSVEGAPVYSSEQLRALVGKRAGEVTEVKVLRNGQPLTLAVTPELNPEQKAGRMGVQLGDRLQVVRPGPTPVEQFREILVSMAGLVKAVFHSKETGIRASSISGPVGIFGIWWYGIVSGGLLQGINIAVLLNINLAIINLLPIPVLDGGHIIFSVIEGARRKPLNARLVHATTMTFAALLVAFMLYVTFFDVQRILLWQSRPAAVPSGTATNQP